MSRFPTGVFLVLTAVLTAAAQPPVRHDALGDPLPPGATARLGTSRWRCSNWLAEVVFAPDGKSVATSTYLGEVYLWAAHDGRLLRRFTTQERGRFEYRLAFSPDSAVLAAALGDQVCLWDTATGRVVHAVEAGDPERPFADVAFTPDGKRFLTAGQQRPVELRAIATGKVLHRIGDDTFAINSLDVSGDGRYLATGFCIYTDDERDFTVRLYDLTTGRELRRFAALQSPASRLSFSRDGRRLAASNEQGVHVWEIATGQKGLYQRTREPQSVVFAPDGRTFAVVRVEEGSVEVCEAATGHPLQLFPGAVRVFGRAAFSPDGKHVVTTCNLSGGRLRLWNLESGTEVQRLPGHEVAIQALALSADGKTLASSEGDGRLLLWDLSARRLLGQLQLSKREHFLPQRNYSRFRFAPDGQTLWAQAGQAAITWDLRAGRIVEETLTNAPPHRFGVPSPNGSWIAAWGQRGSVELWSAGSKKARHHLQVFPADKVDDSIIRMTFSPDSSLLATGSRDRKFGDRREKPPPSDTVHLWDVQTGRLLRQFRPAPSLPNCFAFSPDGSVLAVDEHPDSPPTLWDVATGKLLRTLEGAAKGWKFGSPDRCFAFCPQGKLLVLAEEDGELVLYATATGRILHRWRAHEGFVTAFLFSPDARALITGSSDSSIVVWDVAALLPRAAHSLLPPPTKNPTGTGSIPEVLDGLVQEKPRTSRILAEADKSVVTTAQLDELWADLGGADVPRAFRAIALLSRAGDRAVTLLNDKVKPRGEGFTKRLERLLAELDSRSFRTRQQAARDLESLGSLAETAIRDALAQMPSLEMRKRLEEVLEKLRTTPDSDSLRTLRAVEVLEVVGSVEARRVLERLAAGSPLAPETVAAKAALDRLNAERAR